MKRTLSILLVCLMLCTAVPFCGFAADDAMKVVISLEGFTLGQGYYVEPTAYTLDQINELVKKDNFGPFTEDTLTAGMAILAMLNDKQIAYTISYGSWTGGLYISDLHNIEKGTVNFPAVIAENGGPSNENYTPNPDKNLGAGDYTLDSGWMVSVNNVSLPVAASDYLLKKDAAADYGSTYVVRFQYTVIGYGRDLGFGYNDYFSGEFMPGFFTPANKDKAMIAYAESSNTRAKTKAKPVLEKLDAAQSDVDATIEPLGKAETVWDRILNFFDRILAFFKNLFKIG